MTTTPRIYVGTYAKYNNGSIAGAWLDLEDYSDKSEFLEACAVLHSDEADPEFMFQDYEGFPESYYSECSVSEELFEWLTLDEGDKELLAAYRESVSDGTIEQARDNFAGKGKSLTDWVEEFLEETGGLDEVPENLRRYFDYESYARDMQYGGDVFTVEHEGETWVFWNR